MKGIIFAGCSYTHGHGLWYYSKKLYSNYFPNSDIQELIKHRQHHHLRYKDVLRFPRLVSQEFETFEITKEDYSGNDEDSIKFIYNIFEKEKMPFHWSREHFNYDEVGYIIFQTSQPMRCHYDLSPTEKFRIEKDEYEYYKIEKYGFDSLNDYHNKLTLQIFNKIKNTFLFFESKNINCLIFNWTEHYNDLIENDKFMSERKIEIDFEGKTYKCLDDITTTNKSLLINYDYEYFGNSTPKDYHPSKKFHRIIADSIIKKIKKFERNNPQGLFLNYI